jgi:MoaA/NifB/PqqE/SkfB family radical SAM enzyme/ubiquinone/menaquinone biosynthesis C-methylase UbiE
MKQLSCLPAETFDTWADVYDSQPNPLLALEQRILGPMVPDVRGLDVLDVGCGTGRWLKQLAARTPRSLLGVDISPQMLLQAAAKLGHNCDLQLGSSAAMPFGNAVADVVLSCFVVSYVDDLGAFAQEIDRVTRPGSTVLLTDMHPDTEASRNWKRSFEAAGSSTGMQGKGWSLQQVTDAFLDRGFQLLSLREPTFGFEERQNFDECGRLDLYESAAPFPAIYVLELRKPPISTPLENGVLGASEAIGRAATPRALGPDEAMASSRPVPLGSELASMPILILNVHTHCNCRCVMCDIWKRETHEQIKVADLDRHRASLIKLGVRQVVLTGGEPLLHSDLRALCDFFREQKIRLTLLTTGLLLVKRAQEVSALFDDIIVSIDGPQEIHDGIRRVKGAFDVIGRGVAAVKAHRPGIRISCRTTVQKANHRHLLATVEAAKTLRFDSISFLAADLTSQSFNRALVWPGERQNEIALTETEAAALHDEIERLIVEHADDIRDRFIAESADKLRRIHRRFREHLGHVSPESPVCNAPWVSTVIEVDGSVRPCFFHRPIGNITTSSLEQVVNGEPARLFRESLDVGRNPTCQRCVCSLNYQE